VNQSSKFQLVNHPKKTREEIINFQNHLHKKGSKKNILKPLLQY